MGRFTFAAGLTGACLGGLLGSLDLEVLGAVVGALVGLMAGLIAGEVIDIVAGLLFLNPAVIDSAPPTAAGKVWRWATRLVGLAFLVVFTHELYWAINFLALTASHNLGARMTRAAVQTESRQGVQEALKERRWQMAVFTARPQGWILRDDVEASDEATLEVIDALNGKNVNTERRDKTLDSARRRVWQGDNWSAKDMSNEAMRAAGKEIGLISEELLDKYIPSTWLLRFLPRKMLNPREGKSRFD